MENPLLKYLALVKTVETGSFTRAAQALNYAQSSVSKMVADLEAEWGMTLLERSKRGVCLTSAGEQVLPFLRKVLNDHAELEGQICRMNGIETGVVRIGTFASVAIHWLPNIFSALQRDYPGIGYEMLLGDYDEVERWIGEGRVDCGFLRLPTLPGFDTMLLKQDEYKVVLPVGHPLAVHESVPIEALNGLPFLLLEHGGKTEVSDLLERAHVRPVYDVGGFCDHGYGRTRARRRDPAGSDPAAHPLPHRDPPAGKPLLPPDRPRRQPLLPPDTRSQEVHRIPAVPGSGRMTPRCRICSHTFFLFLLEIKHIFFWRTG